jgi:hypothetical protein
VLKLSPLAQPGCAITDFETWHIRLTQRMARFHSGGVDTLAKEATYDAIGL